MSTIEASPEVGHDDHGHEHDHDHPAFLAHHFDTPEQQFDSGKLGIWLFLVTDCLLYTSPSPRDVEESRMPSSA